MKKLHLHVVMAIVLLCVGSGVVLAQGPTGTPAPTATISLPTQPLMPCPADVTAATVCDKIATQPKDIVGVWSLYFQGSPAFIRYTMDNLWVLGNSVQGTSDPTMSIAKGTYSFDDKGMFTSFFTAAPISEVPKECQAGRYLLRVIMVGGIL